MGMWEYHMTTMGSDDAVRRFKREWEAKYKCEHTAKKESAKLVIKAHDDEDEQRYRFCTEDELPLEYILAMSKHYSLLTFRFIYFHPNHEDKDIVDVKCCYYRDGKVVHEEGGKIGPAHKMYNV